VYPTGTNWWGSAEPIWVSNINSTAAEGEPGRLGTIIDVTFTNITATAENAALLSGVGRPIGPIVFRNVTLTLAVLGNATCRKGRSGSPSACTDYRPPDSAPCGVVLGSSAGLRVEGAGSVEMHDVTISFRTPATGTPSYWLPECVEHATLPVSFDPHPQGFTVTGNPVRCNRDFSLLPKLLTVTAAKPKGTAAPATPNGKTYCCGVGSGPDCGGPDWTPLNFTFSAKGATVDVAITIDSAASVCATEPCVVNGTDVTFTNLANKTDCLGNVVRGTGALTTDLVVKYDPVGDTIAVNVDSEGVAAVLKVCK
jgi:hypothetical protein